MKLSEMGKENLQGFGFAHNCDGAFSLLDDYEFDQDDFEGTICLTVEEAKALLFMSGIFSIDHYTPDRNKELLNNLYRQLLRQDFESTKEYFECFRKNEHFRNEWKRIEQAEKSNE